MIQGVDAKLLAEKLKFAREWYQLSQQEVADILCIDRSTYSYYELGKTQPSLNNLYKLGCMFGISTDDLLNPNVKVSSNLFTNSLEGYLSKKDRKDNYLLKYNELKIDILKYINNK